MLLNRIYCYFQLKCKLVGLTDVRRGKGGMYTRPRRDFLRRLLAKTFYYH